MSSGALSQKILSHIHLGTAQKAGKAIQLSVATKTAVWERTEESAKSAASGFQEAFEKDSGDLPPGTSRVVIRSPADGGNHYTAETWDKEDNVISTIHVPVKE